MNNFPEFDMESMGGNSSFKFSPIENIASIPDAINDVITSDVVFKPGCAWYDGLALQNSLDFSEEQKKSDAGESFQTNISGMVPKLTHEYLAQFNEMRRHRFVVQITDNNGNARISGSVLAGMQFAFDQKSKNTPSGTSGFSYSFSLDHEDPSPFLVSVPVLS